MGLLSCADGIPSEECGEENFPVWSAGFTLLDTSMNGISVSEESVVVSSTTSLWKILPSNSIYN